MHGESVVAIGEVEVRDVFDSVQSVVHARAVEVHAFGRAPHVTREIKERLERVGESAAVAIVFEEAQQTGVQALPKPA